MQSKPQNKKKNVMTLAVVGSIIILVALALVFFVGLFPGISAKSDFNKKTDVVAEGNISAVTVLAPNAPSGIFAETEVEKTINSTEEFRSLFINATEKVSFKERGTELSPSDFKYRIRFITNEGTFDFYIKNGSFYYSEEGIRYYFAPKNTDAFGKLSNYLDDLFELK